MLVVIKGPKPIALGTLFAKGINTVLSIEEDKSWNATLVHIPDRFWFDVQRWFCQGSCERAPYPEGECLFYSHTKVGEEA